MPNLGNHFCGACGMAARECNHGDGPVYNYDLTIKRWQSGRTCWPAWETAASYRAKIANMLKSE